MNSALRSALTQLKDHEAESLWIELETTGNVVEKMIEIIAESHEDVERKLCDPKACPASIGFPVSDGGGFSLARLQQLPGESKLSMIERIIDFSRTAWMLR